MSAVAELFAAATMVLEDAHPVAVAGQNRDVAPDVSRALVERLRAGVAALEAILEPTIATPLPGISERISAGVKGQSRAAPRSACRHCP